MYNPFATQLHPTSEQIAAAIAPFVFDDVRAKDVAQQLELGPADARRFLFSVVILTLDLAVCWGTLKRSVRGKEIDIGVITYACGLVLERLPNARGECRLGDYTLFVEECGALASALLGEQIVIRRDAFDETLLPFFDLAVSVYACRLPQIVKTFTDAARLFDADLDSARGVIKLELANLLLEQASIEPLKVSDLSTASSDRQVTLLLLSALVVERIDGVWQRMSRVFKC
jgi:hypothetical protein